MRKFGPFNGGVLGVLAANQRVVVGSRVIVGGGEVKRIGPKPLPRARGLGRLRWHAPLNQAVIYVGQNRGKEPQNRAGRCAAEPARYSAAEVDRWFNKLRAAQVGPSRVGATRQANRGWYEGDAEASVAYTVIHDPSVDGEKTLTQFQKRMKDLAEDLSERFCQDSVLVVMDTANGKHTFAYDAQPEKKRRRAKR